MNNINKNMILLAHGDGGIKTGEIISGILKPFLKNDILDRLEDSAVFPCGGKKIAFTTDSFVVSPLFFPGGDIGKLSVCGTINDLATSGCTPYALSLSLIIEEGFLISDLEKIIISIKNTLDEAGGGLKIVTGDTKVVEKGNADKLYINTSGIGFIENKINITPANIKKGDVIIINGNIAEHGIAILSCREGFDFKTDIKSDCAPLNGLVSDIMKASANIHALRDATRGGLARVLLELSESSNMEFEIYQENIPLKKNTRGVCEFLGMDPLYIANEGKIVIFSDEKDADIVLKTLRKNKYGVDCAIIGKVTGPKINRLKSGVNLITGLGTKRMLDLYYSEQLPRIC